MIPPAGERSPTPVQEWLRLQKSVRSRLPGPDDLLIETFPRGDRFYLVAYCFEGRNAHQTLGMLLTKRMERAGYAPLGFVATDYVLGVWSAHLPTDMDRVVRAGHAGRRPGSLDGGKLDAAADVPQRGGDLRADRAAACRARNKNRRQVTVNSDLIYDVLRRHQPDHILLRATRADAAGGLTDLSGGSARHAGTRPLPATSCMWNWTRVSPLAVPILLEIGRESVRSAGERGCAAGRGRDAGGRGHR